MVGEALYHAIQACRACGRADFAPVISLGEQALTGWFPKGDDPDPRRAPLDVVRCTGCGLVQLRHSVRPERMYTRTYGYRSNINHTMREHLAGLARSATRMASPSGGDVALDIGCNDGTLLSSYTVPGLVRIGIDPLVGMFGAELTDGIVAREGFFTAPLFLDASGGRKAKIVTAISMFYDLEDPVAFAADVASILDPAGVWIIEQSYLPHMLQENAFDTICHEHLEYYGLAQIEFIARQNGLRVFDVALNRINGGSFRVHLCHDRGPFATRTETLESLRRLEREMAMDGPGPYATFRDRVARIRDDVRILVVGEAARGKTIYAYGASTKGNVLLQYCGLDHRVIAAAADRNPSKWGARTPLTGIPIVSEHQARAARPDYFLVLPWHFRDEFVAREADFLARGGRFIFPLPTVEVVGSR